MKRSIWVTAAGLLALSTLSTPVSRAADHRDWPGYQTDIAADITDVYAWMGPAGQSQQVYLVMDVQGANLGATATTKFSDAVQYIINVNSQASYGAMGVTQNNIICKFDNATPQNFECWGPGASGTATEYVKDAVGNTAGKTSASGKMKVFAGHRDDPFFFNIRGFADVGARVKAFATGNMPVPTLDMSGCPTNVPAAAMLPTRLTQNGAGAAGTDDFGRNGLSPLPPGTGGMTNGNILAIVIAIDKSLLTTGGTMLSVWAATKR